MKGEKETSVVRSCVCVYEKLCYFRADFCFLSYEESGDSFTISSMI